MNMTLTFDPADAEEVTTARRVLDGLIEPIEPIEPPSLPLIVSDIAGEEYGDNRLGFLKLLVAAGEEGIDIQETKDTHFEGSHQKYGGTRASIEKSWRGLGGQAFAPALISERNGRHYLLPEAIELLSFLLDGDY